MREARPSRWGEVLDGQPQRPIEICTPRRNTGGWRLGLYWLDNDPEQGPSHAPFTLSGGGEEIALLEWNEAAGVWVILDFFQFGLSYQDASLG